MDEQEKYEHNKYCTQCWEDWKDFIYQFTCSSWDVFNCVVCNYTRVIWFKPNY